MKITINITTKTMPHQLTVKTNLHRTKHKGQTVTPTQTLTLTNTTILVTNNPTWTKTSTNLILMVTMKPMTYLSKPKSDLPNVKTAAGSSDLKRLKNTGKFAPKCLKRRGRCLIPNKLGMQTSIKS